MAEQTIEERVRSIIVDQLNVNEEQVTLEASFIDDIDGETPEADAEKLTTVGDVDKYISEKSE